MVIYNLPLFFGIKSLRLYAMYVNTEEFRRPALHFETNKYYTAAVPGTKEYFDYWDEQERRCMEGYSVGGMRITGYHYFYLNFSPILRVEDKYLITKQKGASKSLHLPAFWDGDYNYFWALEIAKYGILHPDYYSIKEKDDLRLTLSRE